MRHHKVGCSYEIGFACDCYLWIDDDDDDRGDWERDQELDREEIDDDERND